MGSSGSTSYNDSIDRESPKYGIKISGQSYCGVCFNEYDDRTHIPMSLKCGHTYCKLCVDQLILKNPKCPLCRENISKNSPVKNYGLLDLIPSKETEEIKSESPATQLEKLSEELQSEINDHVKKTQTLTKLLENAYDIHFEQSMNLSADTVRDTIADIESTLDSIRNNGQIVPNVIASLLHDPIKNMLKVYQKVESGVKIMCIHQPNYNSGLTYGNISVWSNTIFFHSLTNRNPDDCKEFLAFEDLKKVIPVLKIKMFLKVKTTTSANHIVLIKPVESPLLPQFIRLCTGETGSCYRGASFEKGEDKDSYCKSVMKLDSYQRGRGSNKGNIDYAFETTTEVCYRDPTTVVVASLDGGFQIFHSDYKAYYKNVVGVIEIPLNIKDILSYTNGDYNKIVECGIAFQL